MTAAVHIATHKTEALLFFTLLQLTVIVLAARIGGEIALRIGQSAVVGEIIVGILLGPSLFGLLAPELFQYVFHSGAPEPMQMLSQIGLEFDFSHLSERRNRKAMLWVAAASLIAPFALGYSIGQISAPRLSPGAHPVAAALNDVIGWLLLALITTLTLSDFDAASFALKVALVLVFFAVSWFGVRLLMKRILHRFDARSGALTNNLLGIVLAAIFLSAMTTYQLGIFAIFGGFMMGVLLHDEHAFVTTWRARISPFVMVFFLPVFFTYTGLRTNIGSLDSPAAWGWCGLIVFLATLGKFGGAYLAARVAGLNHIESKILGIMMNTRALMELIVINVGYDLGVISQQMFTILVIMAIFSTVITSPLLRRWLPGIGIAVPVNLKTSQRTPYQQNG